MGKGGKRKKILCQLLSVCWYKLFLYEGACLFFVSKFDISSGKCSNLIIYTQYVWKVTTFHQFHLSVHQLLCCLNNSVGTSSKYSLSFSFQVVKKDFNGVTQQQGIESDYCLLPFIALLCHL